MGRKERQVTPCLQGPPTRVDRLDPRTPERSRANGHRFFLNPYEDAAFTKCPKCESKTKVRKFPLVIHIEPSQLFVLNKRCRFCECCDLIIARRSELESLMAATFERRDPAIIGNEYVVVGTLPRDLWRARDNADMRPADLLDGAHVFRDVWEFKMIPGGWLPPRK